MKGLLKDKGTEMISFMSVVLEPSTEWTPEGAKSTGQKWESWAQNLGDVLEMPSSPSSLIKHL